ncbi:MAG TPA: hypothetical protein PLN33_09320 [Hyphomonadaceae bacterium]|nr:hypothetical protein [Hyphomonadaceae bacterium]
MKLSKFDRERLMVEALFQRLGRTVSCTDPHAGGVPETGVDVVAQADGQSVGLQVTEADFGDTPGQDRGEEARNTRGQDVAFAWTPDRAHTLSGFKRAIDGKVVKGFDQRAHSETWLLVSCDARGWGSALSTHPMMFAIDANDLNGLSGSQLLATKFDRAFFHAMSGGELYEWSRTSGWQPR